MRVLSEVGPFPRTRIFSSAKGIIIALYHRAVLRVVGPAYKQTGLCECQAHLRVAVGCWWPRRNVSDVTETLAGTRCESGIPHSVPSVLLILHPDPGGRCQRGVCVWLVTEFH